MCYIVHIYVFFVVLSQSLDFLIFFCHYFKNNNVDCYGRPALMGDCPHWQPDTSVIVVWLVDVLTWIIKSLSLAWLNLVSTHQMAYQRTSDKVTHCSIYRPRKDEGLSWPSWLTYSGRFTHINGHPSAANRAQDSESTPAEDWRSTNCVTQPTLIISPIT